MDIRNFFASTDIQKNISVSDRFTDDEKNILDFTIKSITEQQNDIIKNQCIDSNGVFSNSKYESKLITSCIVYPDLTNSSLQQYYGVLGEEKLIKAMLLSGEYSFLLKNILEICGFSDDISNTVDNLKN